MVTESNGQPLPMEGTVDLKLNDKVALVTGSTAGISFAIARALAIEGAPVYVNGRTRRWSPTSLANYLLPPMVPHFV